MILDQLAPRYSAILLDASVRTAGAEAPALGAAILSGTGAQGSSLSARRGHPANPARPDGRSASAGRDRRRAAEGVELSGRTDLPNRRTFHLYDPYPLITHR